MKKLPIGLNSLEKIVKENKVYVDKTKYILQLIENGDYYFLSRPRRFGKTLTVDVLMHLFEGHKELFEGLYIHDKWDWSKTYPVIRIDFSGGDFSSKKGFEERVLTLLEKNEEKLEIKCEKKNPSNCFDELISKAYKKFNSKVVVLIDEYDKPILDNIEKQELAEELRDLLSNFYGVLKGLDENLRFVLLTGVSKFSKVNLFSKLNNLTDITLSRRYSALCGYTEDELDVYFNDYLKDADRDKIKLWYNGYSWLGERVYNPFDILLFISKGFSFRPYWFETGTPTFLMKMIRKERYFIPNLENIEATDAILGSFDVYSMKLEALLWQTGYLTIKDTHILPDGSNVYMLSYPNLEVRTSLNTHIINFLTGKDIKKTQLFNFLSDGDIEGFIENLKSLFASIPYSNFTKNEIARYEGFYGSVIYSYLASIGIDLIGEDITNKGRIDLTVLFDNKAYIFEFKVLRKGEKLDKDPLTQIKEKRYFEKYKDKAKEIYLIGIVFSEEERNIVKHKFERC